MAQSGCRLIKPERRQAAAGNPGRRRQLEATFPLASEGEEGGERSGGDSPSTGVTLPPARTAVAGESPTLPTVPLPAAPPSPQGLGRAD